MSIRERVARAIDAFMFYRKRMLTPKPVLQTIQYRQPHIVKSGRAIPLFGSDPEGFGQDYLQVKSVPSPVQGFNSNVSKPEIENIQGHVSGQPLMTPQKSYEDPNISRSFRRTNESTDQIPIRQRVSIGEVWDGIVRTGQKNPGLQGVRGKSLPTAADLHARDLKENYGYDFSG